MCEILAEILVRNAYLVRNADRTIVRTLWTLRTLWSLWTLWTLWTERAVRQSE